MYKIISWLDGYQVSNKPSLQEAIKTAEVLKIKYPNEVYVITLNGRVVYETSIQSTYNNQEKGK